MIDLLYDGTFAGFLSCVFHFYDTKAVDVRIYEQTNYRVDVFSRSLRIETNLAHAERVWRGLHRKLTTGMCHNLYACYLSREADIENVLLEFIRRTFASTQNSENDYSEKNTLHLHKLARVIFREKHRMEAFVRFQRMEDDLYLSVVEPAYNVLPLIATHFKDRYADQRWIIYDKKRAYGIHYDPASEDIVEVSLDIIARDSGTSPRLYADELQYQQLWQDYFQSVNIHSRKNMKLHIRHVPLKYWKHLTEKQLGKIA